MILTFGIVIILTIVFIAFQLKNIVSLIKPRFQIPPMREMIIERAYRAVDFRANFEYTTLDYIKQINRPFDYFGTERVVRDQGHLDHIVKDFTRDLANQMVDQGFVEVVDQENMDQPYRHRVQIRVKVYKPDF